MAKRAFGARRFLPFLQPILLGIGFALLVVISAATVFLVDRAGSDQHLLANTLKVQGLLSDLLLDVRRAESSERGYLFTNNPDYLDEFYDSEPDAQQVLAQLRKLSKDSPHRLQALDRADALIREKFALMAESIRLNESHRREDARAQVIQGHGRELTQTLRTLIDNAVLEESRKAAERAEQSRRTNRMLLNLALSGAALILLIGVVFIVLVQRTARQRESARNELAVTNANLERIVEYRTADLLEANEEIQRFAYVVSHDLRSPLVNIMGFTSELELLRQQIFAQLEQLSAQLIVLDAQATDAEGRREFERLGKEFDEAIGFIKTSIGNMDRLINAVLKLSREGRRQFQPQTVDMNALLEQIVRNVAHRTEELGATVVVNELPQVESDRLALEQVFSNLLDNALKYGRPEAAPRVEISGRASATHVVYEVKDNGRGVDPRDHKRVFELFRRSGSQDRPGEGIGLAHVRALLRRLGGKIGLQSAPGQGSTFSVTLPRSWQADHRSAA
jgi:signal transduction histidine kinase